MFWSYTLKDVVEIEPVYFPSLGKNQKDIQALYGQKTSTRSNHNSHNNSNDGHADDDGAGGRSGAMEDELSSLLPPAVVKPTTTSHHSAPPDGGDDREKRGGGDVHTKMEEEKQDLLLFPGSSPSTCTFSNLEKIPVKPMVAPSISIWSDLLLHRLTERYVGKVVPRLGFCLAVEHILEYTPCVIQGPHAAAWTTAVFDICVFAPSPATRFRAKISHQDELGIRLSIDFFAGFRIFVPAAELVEGSVFNKDTATWALMMTEEDGEEEVAVMGHGGGAGENGKEEEEKSASPSPHASSALMDNVEDGAVPFNLYVHLEDVIAKVIRCDIIDRGIKQDASPFASSSLPPYAHDAEQEGEELMAIVASFRGDCLGPISWFD